MVCEKIKINLSLSVNCSSDNSYSTTNWNNGSEYGLGSEVSTNGDMYSYGILLLEMITGKAPTDEMFVEGFTLHRYAESALADHDPATGVMAIVDPFLLPISYDGDREERREDEASTSSSSSSNTENRRRNERKVECLVKMAKIGVCCSVESPQERMDIAGVIRELNAVENLLRAPARVRLRRGLIDAVPLGPVLFARRSRRRR